jgi:pimeloyl-ACP methyl ester carboxylesterase
MTIEWELRKSGPADAERTVLLLPGGMCNAGSFAEVMDQPALARVRLVAATLPGHCGAPPPDDFSVESYAESVAQLAAEVGADAVVGFSMGAAVAVEMLTSRRFAGPTVLLGVSLSAKDEPAIFRAIVRLGAVFGALPSAVLIKGAASMVKRVPVPTDRQAELRADLAKNVARDIRIALREYVRWLRHDGDRARRLCQTGVPTWIVHAEKGDGGLTDVERRTLETCSHTQVVTMPGHVLLIPNETPQQVAELIVGALASAM